VRVTLFSFLWAAPGIVIAQAQFDWPPDVESLLIRYVAELSANEFSDIAAHCDSKQCEVTFFGAGAGPRVSSQEDRGVIAGLHQRGLNVMTSSFGTRETSPGVYQYVLTLSNVPHVE
jgi:hypothetical protein